MLTLLGRSPSVKQAVRLVAAAVLCVAFAPSRPADPFLGTRSPALERLFTPPAVPRDLYEVYESPRSIEQLAAALRARDAAPHQGAWHVRQIGPGDAFGAEGSYDRARLAMLVGGRRISVARGSLRNADGTLTGFTLLSPYPDPTLSELRTGTMIIVFHVPATR